MKKDIVYLLLFGGIVLGVAMELAVLFLADTFGVVALPILILPFILISLLLKWYDNKKKNQEKPKQKQQHSIYTATVQPKTPYVQKQGVPAVSNKNDLQTPYKPLTNDKTSKTDASQVAREYIQSDIQKEDAIRILRERMINEIRQTPATVYTLSSLLWKDAADCFSTNRGFSWDGVWFKLDLITRKLFADASTYPNQYGAYREERYSLTAFEFHQKALAFSMSAELRLMETDADWQELFDDELQAAIEEAQTALEKQQEARKQAEQTANAVVIPHEFAKMKPTMEFEEIELELSQRYGESRVCLSKTAQKYMVEYQYSARYTAQSNRSQRKLSSSEAAWLERQVWDCVHNPDESTWQSLPGGDRMSVRICTQDKAIVQIRDGMPLKKYIELKHVFEKLSNYGSVTEKKTEN